MSARCSAVWSANPRPIRGARFTLPRPWRLVCSGSTSLRRRSPSARATAEPACGCWANCFHGCRTRRKPVFIVATANDIERLPPELLRRGRFDEIFFLDLPNQAERDEIFRVHIAQTGPRSEFSFDVDKDSRAPPRAMSARRSSRAVIDAMYMAFSDKTGRAMKRGGGGPARREFTDADILDALVASCPDEPFPARTGPVFADLGGGGAGAIGLLQGFRRGRCGRRSAADRSPCHGSA